MSTLRLVLRCLFFVMCGLQGVEIFYAAFLFIRGGAKDVVSWFYHITPPLTTSDPLAFPSGWEIAVTEVSLLLITWLLWRVSRSPGDPNAHRSS